MAQTRAGEGGKEGESLGCRGSLVWSLDRTLRVSLRGGSAGGGGALQRTEDPTAARHTDTRTYSLSQVTDRLNVGERACGARCSFIFHFSGGVLNLKHTGEVRGCARL